jgi:hypothetical protein
MLFILIVPFEENNQALVAQWIAHLTSNQEVVGSSPTESDKNNLKNFSKKLI